MRPKKIIFVGNSGASRAPMAAAIMQTYLPDVKMESRGTKVLFPEPLNQKTRAVLAGNGITVPEDFESVPFSAEDADENTLMLAMSAAIKDRVLAILPEEYHENVSVLSEFAGEELETIDPYGQALQVYGLCFETMQRTLGKVADLLQEESDERQA